MKILLIMIVTGSLIASMAQMIVGDYILSVISFFEFLLSLRVLYLSIK